MGNIKYIDSIGEVSSVGFWAAEQLIKQPKSIYIVITTNSHIALDVYESARLQLKQHQCFIFSGIGILPYDYLVAQESIIAERISTLQQLQSLKSGVIVVALPTILRRLPPKDFINRSKFDIKVGTSFLLSQKNLLSSGYRQVNQVDQAGEFCRRGEVFDIFPIGSKFSLRLILDDDEIEAIHELNLEEQLTTRKMQSFSLLARQEFPFDEKSREDFCTNFSDCFPDHKQNNLLQHARTGVITPGFDSFLPLFFSGLSSFFDFFPDNTSIVTPGNDDIKLAIQQFNKLVSHRFSIQQEHGIPALPPEKLISSELEFFTNCKALNRYSYKTKDDNKSRFKPLDTLLSSNKGQAIELRYKAMLKIAPNLRVVFLANSLGRAQVFADQLERLSLPINIIDSHTEIQNKNTVKIQVVVSGLERGFFDSADNIAYIPLYELENNGSKANNNQQNSESSIALNDLAVGDLITHYKYGVGRFVAIEAEEGEEFVVIDYAQGQQLFVSMHDLHLLTKYSNANESAELHSLSSKKWNKTRQQVWKKAQDTAAELLKNQALREQSKAPVCVVNQKRYRDFSEAFPYQETSDQHKAIYEVLGDMQTSTPMDRLLCGDVGLGKTEVALRATFLAVNNGYQVAILVPTTLLCEQHFERLRDRFAQEDSIRIAMVSRFQTQGNRSSTYDALEAGKIDIVVCTHAIIKKIDRFKNLGLLIIDEEQRFGVKQKESILEQCRAVHRLSMTATPIPRSLNMAMNGLRDISLIATPPKSRLAIKTIRIKDEGDVIVDAITREIERGGQVYYIFNKVSVMEEEKKRLQRLLPNCKIAFAHGQMPSAELEQVVSQFYHRKIEVLICSTIVETGIDIPNVNAMIIQGAHNFGLSQLHQLRGRVGRSHLQAYCYLAIPDTISADAKKRLNTITKYHNLGDGFNIAMQDLEIRGAGDLLGKQQSGHMQSVGVGLYLSMVEQAMQLVKSGKISNSSDLYQDKLTVNLHFNLTIPHKYINSVEARLIYYQQIAKATTYKSLYASKQEIIDKFGQAPDMINWLFDFQHMQITAQSLGITSITMNKDKGYLSFVDSDKLIQGFLRLIAQAPDIYALHPDMRFSFCGDFENEEKSIKILALIIGQLNIENNKTNK